MKEYKWYVEVVVDTNDADYLTRVISVTDEGLEELKRRIAVVKRRFPNYEDFACSEYHGHWAEAIEEDDPDYLDLEAVADMAPYGEYGWHSLESIKYYPYGEKKSLL